MFSIRSKKFALVLLAGAATALAAAGWARRGPVLAWYYVDALTRADDAAREAWAERVAGLDEAALPRLLDGLGGADERAGSGVAAALTRLARRWAEDPDRLQSLAEQLETRFETGGLPGRRVVLDLFTAWVRPDDEGQAPAPGIVAAGQRLLQAAARAAEPEIRGRAVDLAAALPVTDNIAVLGVHRELARAGLADADPAVRARAVHLATQPGVQLLNQVVPLLRDPHPEVRRAVMAAVGPDERVVATDDLLPWLHDGDEEVRRLCEAALLGPRGLGEDHVRLGRLITDAQPAVRLQVLDTLRRANDLEPGVWLRRLTYDPAPAVRVAAIRAAHEESQVDLTDRFAQMSREDPSPTVSQLAGYYLARPRATAVRP